MTFALYLIVIDAVESTMFNSVSSGSQSSGSVSPESDLHFKFL